MNNLTQALKNHFRQITYTLLTACMLLAIGVSGVQAQDDDDPPVPDPMPSQYFFKVGDEKVNDITLAPGENFILKVGFTLIGPCDGATVTLLWHNDELLVPGTQVTNLIGSLLPFGFWNVISQDIGHLSFTQAMLGGFILPEEDGQGGYVETDYMLMEFQVDVPEGSTWASSTIRHQINSDTVDYSAMTFYGASLVDYENIPTFTIYNSEAAAVDCPDLDLNIGDACDDGDDSTENDVVTADCECVGTIIPLVGCETTSQFGAANVASPDTMQISGCTYFGEYSVISGVVSGYEYEFTGEENTSGNLAFITVRSDSSSGPVVAAGVSPLTITATSAANLYVHWNADSDCGTASNCATTTAACITCATVEDCEGVAGGSALPGTSCDDGDAGTINDVYDADCNCAGELPTLGAVCETAFPLECNAEPATYSSELSNGSNTTTCFMGNKGLWFSFMGTGGEIIVNSSATFDHEMSINRGSCDSLTNVACRDGSTLAETYTIANSAVGEMYYVYIAHYASGNNTTGDITISVVCAEPPTCPAPSALAVDNITANSADVSWTAGENETEWEVLYGEAGFDVDSEGISANVTSTTTTLDNLEANISYGVYVRAVCGVDDNSDWVGPVSFTTTLEGGYCAVSFPSNVEPITYVNFAGIDNTSDATINGSPALENFTDQTASVNQGGNYPIEVQGNTSGNFTTRIVVFVDWNQDGVFDDSEDSDERYLLPDIYGSNGEDGIASEGFIEVPGTALLGNTRMRVLKRFSTIPGPCNTAGYGQAEDYSVNVSGESGPLNDNCENAISLECGSSVEGSTIGATWSGITDNCSLQDNPDVWFSLDVEAGTEYTVTVNGDDFDAIIAAYTGECDSLYTLICADDYPGDGVEESITWTAINTETVTIRTYDFSTDGGSFTISVSCAIGVDCPELNANYGDECELADGEMGIVSGDCECVPIVDCIAPEFTLAVQDANGEAIEGCLDAGSEYFVVATLSGGEGNDSYYVSLNDSDAEEVDANSSTTFGPYIVGTNINASALGVQDQDCVAYATASSPEVCDGDIPSNDDCEDAIALSPGDSVDGSTATATNSGLEGCAFEDVFYTLDVVVGTQYTIILSGATFDGLLGIYTGDCDDLTLVSCVNEGGDGDDETYIFTPDEDETLVIQVGDNGLPGRNFTITVISGVAPLFDCPILELNFGSECPLADGRTGAVNLNCECEVIECTDFRYFLSDHDANDGLSDIYEVKLNSVGGVATLSFITQIDHEVHIAYNGKTNEIYAVGKFTNSYQKLTEIPPSHSGIWTVGSPIAITPPGTEILGEITAAVIAPDGKLLIGTQSLNKRIWELDVMNNAHNWATYVPVYGGDIAFDSFGKLYLATRSNSALYEVPQGSGLSTQIGLNNVFPPLVTGMAITDADQFLISAQGQTSLLTYTGSVPDLSYTLELNGNPFTLRDGDMASGCNTKLENEGPCEDFKTFYVDHRPFTGSDLYKVGFTGTSPGTATLQKEVHVDFEAHIGFDAANNLVYLVDADGFVMRTWNGSTLSLPITLSGVTLTKITAVVYYGGKLYVGDDNSNAIYEMTTGGYVTYVGSAPVSGGDIAIVDNGDMYLATRSGNDLRKIVPQYNGGSNWVNDIIKPYVTGIATANDNSTSLILSNKGLGYFTKVNLAGFTVDTYNIMLNTIPFTTFNGDMASGCNDGIEVPRPLNLFQGLLQSQLTTYPNPTPGPSTVVFVTAETGRTLVEVYDMSGRNVATLFNQVAQQSQEYRLDFNGAALPNGVYIYRMTTQNETIIEKFMIAK